MTQADDLPQPTPKIKTTDSLSSLIHYGVIIFGNLCFVILVVLLVVRGYPASLDLHFNIFAVLSGVALIANLVALVLIIRVKGRSDILTWFAIFVVSVAAWAGASMMYQLSATPVASAFWNPFTLLGAVFMPVALYMFGLSYTNPKRSISPFVFPILAGVSALLLFADSHSTLLNVYNPALMTASHWGFSAPTGPAYIIISLWIVLLTLATVLLLIRFRRRTLDPQLRNQTKLFVIALVIPLSIGTVTDGILPVLDINILPPMAVFLLTITALMISYSILKQKFLSFTPDIIAKEVLGTMNEAVIGVTADFRLSYVNSGAERLFGRAAHDLTNISIQDVLADAWTSDQLRQKIFFPLSSQEFYTIDSVRFIDSSGKPIVTKLSVSRIGNDNQASGYLLVITDISDLAKSKALIEQEVVNRTHQLRDEKAKLLSSIESLNIGFLLINIGGVVNLKNKAINNIFGLSGTEEITTKYLEERLVGVDFNEISQQLWRGQSITIDQVALGTKILKIFFGPVLTDEKNSQKQTIGWVVLIEDITEATIQERSKDEFFSIASHELRTPLTSIKGNASLILDFYKEILKDPELKEMVEDIHTSSVRLIEIVNDFLDVSRLEQGKISFAYTSVSVEKIVENVAYEMKAVLDEKKLYLKIDKQVLNYLPEVWADENRLKQIIYNLVGNASKFTETGGISIDALVNDKFVKVLVSDTGRGMTPESQLLLFHKFQQASSSLLTRDTTRGTGLGLYISKMIVENMGGKIILESSEIDKGSTFSFTLPIASAEQKTSKPKQPTSSTDSKTGLTAIKPEP